MNNEELLWEKLDNEFFFERDNREEISYSMEPYELEEMRRDVVAELLTGEKSIQVEMPYEDEDDEYYMTLSEIAYKYGYELETYTERDEDIPLVEIECLETRNEVSTLWKN